MILLPVPNCENRDPKYTLGELLTVKINVPPVEPRCGEVVINRAPRRYRRTF